MTPRDLPPSVPVTALRVFEPLEAFPPEQRRPLARLAADPAAASRADDAERRAAWRRVLGRPDGGPDGAVVARVLRVEGAVLLCPLSAEPPGQGLLAFAAGSPDPSRPELGGATSGGATSGAESSGGAASGAVGSPSGASVTPAAPGTGGLASEPAAAPALPMPGGAAPGPVARPDQASVPPRRHTLVRAWELPVAWLAIVRPEDLTRSGGPARYVMPMARARARAARALRTLRTHLGELDVTADAEGLARWLEAFHPRSWVEVDARPVAALVDGEDGADDVRLGLDSLTAGEGAAVAAAYQRLRRRSRRLEELSLSS